MKIGISKIDITPQKKVELSGYGFYLQRFSEGVKNKLYSKCILFSSGSEKLAIVTIDAIGINKSTTDYIRKAILSSTGIPKENILVSAVHSHSTPASVFLKGVGGYDEDYVNFMRKQIINGILNANRSLIEAKMEFDKVPAPAICFNRAKNSNEIKNNIDIVKITDIKDNLITTAFFYGCHSVVLRSNNLKITPDYSFYSCEKIERDLNIQMAAFFQGNCGDIDPKTEKNDFKEAELIGHRLAYPVISALKTINTKKELNISTVIKKIRLPVSKLSLAELEKIKSDFHDNDRVKYVDTKYPNHLRVETGWINSLIEKHKKRKARNYIETEIQFIKLNSTILVGIPGEMFYTIEKSIKSELKAKNIIFIDYANDFIGYIPDEDDFITEGYASRVAPIFLDNFHFKRQIVNIIKEKIIKTIGEL